MGQADGLAAVVPVINEATAIGDVVRALRKAGACCVFVVDGDSTDGTDRVASEAGAFLVREPRRGYGRACLTGASVALRVAARTDRRPEHRHASVAFLDGDGSCDPADLPALAARLEAADVVLGRRVRERIETGALPWHARLGNLLVAGVLCVRTRRRIHDLPPFKVLRAGALERLALDDQGFGWTVQLVGRALADPGITVAEQPVAFRRRNGGRSKVSGSVRASLAAAVGMLKAAFAASRARPVLALMAKEPRAGHAKTRLAADVGEQEALRIWCACLEDAGRALGATARTLGLRSVVVVPDAAAVVPVLERVSSSWEPLVQARPGLAGAILQGLLVAWDAGATFALAISGDSPGLPEDRIVAACAWLRRGEAVLGPCPDGGYYLFGIPLSRPSVPLLRHRARRRFVGRIERVFLEAELGTGGALVATARALRRAGWPVRVLKPWLDIDRRSDLVGLEPWLDAGDAAPAVREWLASRGHTQADGEATLRALVPAPVVGPTIPR